MNRFSRGDFRLRWTAAKLRATNNPPLVKVKVGRRTVLASLDERYRDMPALIIPAPTGEAIQRRRVTWKAVEASLALDAPIVIEVLPVVV